MVSHVNTVFTGPTETYDLKLIGFCCTNESLVCLHGRGKKNFFFANSGSLIFYIKLAMDRLACRFIQIHAHGICAKYKPGRKGIWLRLHHPPYRRRGSGIDKRILEKKQMI